MTKTVEVYKIILSRNGRKHLIEHLERSCVRLSNDDKMMERVDPAVSAWLLLLINTRVAIARRFR